MNDLLEKWKGKGDGAAIVVRPDFGGPPIEPVMRTDFVIRKATRRDIPFIDQMQRIFTGNLGFLYTKVLEQTIERGEALLAVDRNDVPMGYITVRIRTMGTMTLRL